jgi:RimJ/RimL family protein N-acetyltransferase
MDDLSLRPFDRQDFARLIAWIETPEALVQWAGGIFRFPLDTAQLDAYRVSGEGELSPRRILAARDGRGGLAGHIELNDIDGHSSRICRVLVDPARRGRGIGSIMVREVLRLAFDQLRLHRVELLVFDFNTAAIRCYEGAGFVLEGHLRDARRVGNSYWSLELMAILEGEWRARQAKTSAAPGADRR